MSGLREEGVPIRLHNVAFSYPGGGGKAAVPAVDDVSCTMESGTITGLVGVNGAGKTTLLDLMAGALPPNRGTILRFGEERHDRNQNGRLALCQDVPALPDFLTVRENLALACALQGVSRTDARARIADLTRILELDSLLSKRAGILSRGNRVRVGLAVALAGRPEVLLLDEVFGPLDPLAQRLVRTVLVEEARRGTSVLVSSHQLDQLAQIATRVYLMHEGKLAGPFPMGGKGVCRYLVARSFRHTAPGETAIEGRGMIRLGSIAILPFADSGHPDAETLRRFGEQCHAAEVTVEDLTLEQMLVYWSGQGDPPAQGAS